MDEQERPLHDKQGRMAICRTGLDKHDRMQDKQDRTQEKQNGIREVLGRKGRTECRARRFIKFKQK